MPVDLTNPFGESCCDGGACSSKESARPCGCDYGHKDGPHFCAEHAFKERLLLYVHKWRVFRDTCHHSSEANGAYQTCISDMEEFVYG